ncbi:MAG: hypothetical protein HZA14_12155 [Nitrospirae bacterium]|nr:hypothetical protein [Nitrospirota bacterium]
MKMLSNVVSALYRRATQITLFFLIAAIGVLITSAKTASAVEVKLFEDNYKMKFYGFVNAVAMYDSKGAKGIDWAFASKNSGDEDSALEFNADNSRFGFLLTGNKENDVPGSGLAEFDFVSRKSGNTLRIRHLYADLNAADWHMLIGQTVSMLGNLGPSTINTTWLWGQGNPYNLLTMLRLSRNFGDLGFNLAAVQQGGMGDIIGDGEIKSNQPNLQANLTFKKGSLAGGLGGNIGRVRVKASDGTKTNVTSSLVAAEASVAIPAGAGNSISLTGKAFTGSGGGLGTGAGQFAVIDASNEAHAIKSSGGFVDLGFDIGKTHIHGIAGVDNPKDKVENVTVTRTKNQTVIGNISYDLTKAINIGLEYQQVKTKITGSSEETDMNNRVLASVYYNW